MPILDFANLTNTDLQAYFHEGALSHDAGYSNYEGEFVYQNGDHYKQRLTDFFSNEGITGAIDILELGGARGHRAVYAMDTFPGFKSWEIIDIYDSPNKLTHAKLTYTFGDARVLLIDTKTYKNNGKDISISFRFLECVPEADLPSLITELNRVTKTTQYHVIGTAENGEFYSTRDLLWWSTQGFATDTVLISSKDFQHGDFSNIVRVA